MGGWDKLISAFVCLTRPRCALSHWLVWGMSSAKSMIADLTWQSPHTPWLGELSHQRCRPILWCGSQCNCTAKVSAWEPLLYSFFCTAPAANSLTVVQDARKKGKCKSCMDSNSVHPSGLKVSALAHLWGDLKQLFGLSHLTLWIPSIKNHQGKHEKKRAAFNFFFKTSFVLLFCFLRKWVSAITGPRAGVLELPMFLGLCSWDSTELGVFI